MKQKRLSVLVNVNKMLIEGGSGFLERGTHKAYTTIYLKN